MRLGDCTCLAMAAMGAEFLSWGRAWFAGEESERTNGRCRAKSGGACGCPASVDCCLVSGAWRAHLLGVVEEGSRRCIG